MWTHIMSVFNWCFSEGEFLKFYHTELRSEFFNGFLSLAAFMLAAKTFIVIHMKQEVFDKPLYERKFDERKRQAGEKEAKRYGPLERMSQSLYWIVVSSVVAAVFQVTIGLLPWNIAGIVCLIVVAFALWKFVCGLVLMQKNLDSWFEIVHEEDRERESASSTHDEPKE